jgi:hypothetical protein
MRFLNHFPPVRLTDAARRAPIGNAVAVRKSDDFSFRKYQSVSCCFSRSERLGRMASSEWRMEETPNGPLAIRYSLFAIR